DGNGLLGFGERTIHLWDFATGKPLRQFQAPVERFRYVALSPDGKTLAATAQASSFKVSTSVYLWEVASGKALPSLDGHDEGAYCVAFAPDGKTLVAADPKNNYRWEFPSGKLLGRFPRAAGQAPAAFSPDRTILVAEDFAADNFAVDNLWAVDT